MSTLRKIIYVSIIVVGTLLSLHTIMYILAVESTKEFKQNLDEIWFVQDCVPIFSASQYSQVPIQNDTHKFIWQTCEWADTNLEKESIANVAIESDIDIINSPVFSIDNNASTYKTGDNITLTVTGLETTYMAKDYKRAVKPSMIAVQLEKWANHSPRDGYFHDIEQYAFERYVLDSDGTHYNAQMLADTSGQHCAINNTAIMCTWIAFEPELKEGDFYRYNTPSWTEESDWRNNEYTGHPAQINVVLLYDESWTTHVDTFNMILIIEP